MGKMIEITASDGHVFDAFVAEPAVSPVAGLVLIHEIAGVNDYVKRMAYKWATEGYRVVCPALFDRVRRGHAVSYQPEGLAAGRKIAYGLDREKAVSDVADAMKAAELADVEAALGAAGPGPVGVVGYCFGGSMTWLAATRINPPPAACVSYYGRWVSEYRNETPNCPIILHFGEEDPFIPIEDVHLFRRAQPDLQTYIYRKVGHGFSCDERDDWFDRDADALAFDRSRSFFRQYLGQSKDA
ncbi:MAG: dienelactone hydrolase family protein [Myxococcota bacterium]